MRARFRSWWENTSKTLKIVQIIVLVAVIGLIVLFILGYIFNWTWTGVGPYVSPTHPQGSDFQREKTLFDWFQLAIIPVALAVGVWWLNRLQQQRDQKLADKRAQDEQKIATDNQYDTALQTYLDRMSELLLKESLRKSQPDDEVRKLGRTWTKVVLTRLDPKRKGSVLKFLFESYLIEKGKSIIDISRAELNGAYLREFNLSRADLSDVDLRKAELSSAGLNGADLLKADLREASLREADLSGADLSGADLRKADLREANLSYANLNGTLQPHLFEGMLA
jgi:uncharacterized protein YjbI with pentapeptide repeats